MMYIVFFTRFFYQCKWKLKNQRFFFSYCFFASVNGPIDYWLPKLASKQQYHRVLHFTFQIIFSTEMTTTSTKIKTTKRVCNCYLPFSGKVSSSRLALTTLPQGMSVWDLFIFEGHTHFSFFFFFFLFFHFFFLGGGLVHFFSCQLHMKFYISVSW